MDSGRLEFTKPTNYDKQRVLLGNWVEDRNNYVKNLYKFRTTYDNCFTAKPYSAPSKDSIWDSTFKTEGYGRLIFDHDGSMYDDNFSSTYDLSYNHIPKLFRAKPQQRPKSGYKGEIDLTLNYGPVTSRGLKQIKTLRWVHEKLDPRVTVNSLYKDTFVKCAEKPLFVRFNKKCHCLPGETGYNPITWEYVTVIEKSMKT